MDSVKLEKIQALNRYKKQQLLNNLFLYSFTALTCSLFCSSPFWYPPLFSCLRIFLFISLPQVSSLFLTSKFFFILGNLIVIFLVGESKFFTSDLPSATDVYHDECANSKKSFQNISPLDKREEANDLDKSFAEGAKDSSEGGDVGREGWVEEREEFVEEREDEDEDEDLDRKGSDFPAEEINKRADDFIARINKQRKLEATLLFSCTE